MLRKELTMLSNDVESYEIWGVANDFSDMDQAVANRVQVGGHVYFSYLAAPAARICFIYDFVGC
jgi:hypothetical protein